jgi:hypothetical protein
MAFNHERSMIAINPTPKECKDYRGVRIIEHPTIEINPTPKGIRIIEHSSDRDQPNPEGV